MGTRETQREHRFASDITHQEEKKKKKPNDDSLHV